MTSNAQKVLNNNNLLTHTTTSTLMLDLLLESKRYLQRSDHSLRYTMIDQDSQLARERLTLSVFPTKLCNA